MADSVQFDNEAQKILEKLQELLNEDDEKKFTKLKSTCKDFIKFYKKYYENAVEQLKNLQQQYQRIKNLKNSVDQQYINQQSAYTQHRQESTRSIQEYMGYLVNGARQLENLLTGFKSVFLNILGQNFVQQIVVESENYQPIIIQLKDFSSMSYFIKEHTTDFQGKLKSNIQMLKMVDAKQHNNLYTKIWVEDPYIKIYQQSRRRLNIFYDNVKNGSRQGEALLLYKPHQRWLKFFVLNLGDLKEGFVSMVSDQAQTASNMEQNIEIFTKYIGKVDNIQGALLQDVQNIIQNLQISVKSGSAETGSHNVLINMINEISKASGNNIRKIIEDTFSIDYQKAIEEKGQRDKLYTNKEAKEKIATMISKQSGKKAEQAVEVTAEDLKKAGNLLIRIQASI